MSCTGSIAPRGHQLPDLRSDRRVSTLAAPSIEIDRHGALFESMSRRSGEPTSTPTIGGGLATVRRRRRHRVPVRSVTVSVTYVSRRKIGRRQEYLFHVSWLSNLVFLSPCKLTELEIIVAAEYPNQDVGEGQYEPRSNVETDEPTRLRQPRNVEHHGVEPVPPEERTVRWFDLFQIIVNVLLNPGLILIGGLAVVSGLSFWAAVTAQVLGVIIAFTAYTVMATVGVDYGLPGIVSTRAFVGIGASRWIISILRAISSAFWFAFQTLAGAMGIHAVLNQWLGLDVSLVILSLAFAVLQASVALFGYGSLKWLSKIAFPTKIVILGYLFYVLATHDAPGFAPSEVFAFTGTEGWKWAVFALWVNAVAASWFSQVTDAADYCRYSRSRKDMWIGTMAAAVIGTAGSAFFGAYAAAATLGQTANAFEVIPTLNVGGATLALVLIVLVLDNWTINVLNLYTGGLSLANLTTRLGRFWSTIIVAAAGTILASIPALVNDFSDFMSAMGNLFAPIVGVIIADYVVLKRGYIDVAALFDPAGPYRYFRGVNVLALTWSVVGSLIYFALPTTVLPIPLVAVVSGLGYLLSARLLPQSALVPDHRPLDSGRPTVDART